MAAAVLLAAGLWLVGGGRLPRWLMSGSAALVLLGSLVLRKDIGVGLIVPHVVARRSPKAAAIAFGAFLGGGLARQRRGFWAALVLMALGASSFWSVAAAMAVCAVARCSAPLLAVGCSSRECVMSRLAREHMALASLVGQVVLAAVALSAATVGGVGG